MLIRLYGTNIFGYLLCFFTPFCAYKWRVKTRVIRREHILIKLFPKIKSLVQQKENYHLFQDSQSKLLMLLDRKIFISWVEVSKCNMVDGQRRERQFQNVVIHNHIITGELMWAKNINRFFLIVFPFFAISWKL